MDPYKDAKYVGYIHKTSHLFDGHAGILREFIQAEQNWDKLLLGWAS